MSGSHGRPVLSEALRRIRLVMLDVDGVLTTGLKLYSAAGIVGLEFDARDGLGIALLRAAGCTVGLVSNGDSGIVRARAADLLIDIVILGSNDKTRSIETEALDAIGVSWNETLIMGDDIWDVPAMQLAAVAVAPKDAHPSARSVACWVTESCGGRGAVREMADLLLAAKGLNPVDLLTGL